jgi:hypothetical protein
VIEICDSTKATLRWCIPGKLSPGAKIGALLCQSVLPSGVNHSDMMHLIRPYNIRVTFAEQMS